MSASPPPIAADVTVVIPTAGGPFLRGCLESIARGTRWPARLIVVDQGATPSAHEATTALRRRGIDVLHLLAEARGISAATNRGLEQVATPYVAITHDDCRVEPDWLERLAERLPAAGNAVLTGRVNPEGDGVVLTIKTDDKPATYARPLLDGDVLFPPNMAFAIRLLEIVGPFDEHPSLAVAGEDNEWAHRALRAGVKIVYEPGAVVGHLARHGTEDLPALYVRYARGQGAFYGTWLRRGDVFIACRAVRDLLRSPWLLLRGLATRNRDLIAMGRGEVAGLLPGIVAGLRNRGIRGAREHTES